MKPMSSSSSWIGPDDESVSISPGANCRLVVNDACTSSLPTTSTFNPAGIACAVSFNRDLKNDQICPKDLVHFPLDRRCERRVHEATDRRRRTGHVRRSVLQLRNRRP